jgi:hypothetical protein
MDDLNLTSLSPQRLSKGRDPHRHVGDIKEVPERQIVVISLGHMHKEAIKVRLSHLSVVVWSAPVTLLREGTSSKR